MKQAVVAKFPESRGRRLRQSAWVRDLVAETKLTPKDFIWPIFVRDLSVSADIPSMPGVSRVSLDELPQLVRRAVAWGVPALALFPAIDPQKRTPRGDEALNDQNLVCQALACARAESGQIGLIADVALDPFTLHGHDGVVIGGEVHNDATLEVLCEQARIQARSGANILAPSDMMDGRIAAIRACLDRSGFSQTLLLSYAAKYASAFYGPFRQALQAPSLSEGPQDKKTYQMDPANSDEALREVAQDLAEGADMVMIKPALPYLDIIRRVVDQFAVPTFAYQVSGEYAMIQAAAEKGWLNAHQAFLESLTAIKRAGATAICTYATPQVVPHLT